GCSDAHSDVRREDQIERPPMVAQDKAAIPYLIDFSQPCFDRAGIQLLLPLHLAQIDIAADRNPNLGSRKTHRQPGLHSLAVVSMCSLRARFLPTGLIGTNGGKQFDYIPF